MTKVLDHGYIEVIESWGSDESIVEAARMSTNKGFTGWGPKFDHCGCGPSTSHHHLCQNQSEPVKSGDEKLLKYLHDHSHATPFEMAGMIVEVQAPIFVFREWHRHRTQSYNELSARYTPLPDTNYVPSMERLLTIGGATKQSQGTGAVITEALAKEYREHLEDIYYSQQQLYDQALQWGVPKELARVHLPVGRYSRMRASANLRNWLAFLTLRSDKNPNAQWEIRQYANALGEFVKERFPRTWKLFSKESE